MHVNEKSRKIKVDGNTNKKNERWITLTDTESNRKNGDEERSNKISKHTN